MKSLIHAIKISFLWRLTGSLREYEKLRHSGEAWSTTAALWQWEEPTDEALASDHDECVQPVEGSLGRSRTGLEATHFISHCNTLGPHQVSLERRISGIPCLSCVSQQSNPGSAAENKWMEYWWMIDGWIGLYWSLLITFFLQSLQYIRVTHASLCVVPYPNTFGMLQERTHLTQLTTEMIW